MAQRRILFTINHAPFGSIHYTEGLRAVVGATSGIDEHSVDVAYLGDGVFFALKGVDRTDSARYIATLADSGFHLYAEEESLAERCIGPEELAEDIRPIPRQKVLELIGQADFTIDF